MTPCRKRRRWAAAMFQYAAASAWIQPYRSYFRARRPLLVVSDNNPLHSAVTDRFHQDMRRVLNPSSLEESRERQHESSNKLPQRHRTVTLKSDVDGAQRALSMLHHLQEIGACQTETYCIVMEAFLKRGRARWYNGTTTVCAADQLEELWRQLQQSATNSSHPVPRDIYNMVLQAYAVCSTPRGKRNYAGRAYELLQQMQQEHNVTVESYMHVLQAFAWQQGNLVASDDSAQRAHELLDMILQQTRDPALVMQSYDWVLEAWSKSVGGAEKANEIFEKMKQLNATLTEHDKTAGQIFNAETYCNCILAWRKANKGAEKAHSLLLEMVDLYKQGALGTTEPSLIAFNGVISAWGQQGRADKAEQVLRLMNQQVAPYCQGFIPDSICYNSVIYAHLKSPDRQQGLQRALALVQYMQDNHHDQPAIKPNSFTYYNLLKCWIQSGQHDVLAEKADEILVQIEHLWEQGDVTLTPDNHVYNMVINTHAKSNDRHAARKAYTILQRMKLSPKCQPDVITYTSVMECLSKSADPNAATQALELLSEAFQRYHVTGKDRPNLRTFTMAILTLAKSHGSVVQARALLTQLVNLYEQTNHDPDLRPNEYPYNYVLMCAANTLDDNKLEAFRIATQTYQEMRTSALVSPDSFTYAFWLKCCNNLLPMGDLRTRCVSYAFEECKQQGLVSNVVLSRLVQGNPPELVNELLECSSMQPRNGFGTFASLTREHAYKTVRIDDLPRSWSRKAPTRNQRS